MRNYLKNWGSMRKKIDSYLGFAAKSRNLVTGYNTCLLMMDKRKIKLLILAKDLSEKTVKKLSDAAENKNIPYRYYGTVEELSRMCGKQGKGVFGITDVNFAKVIINEIDREDETVEKEVF